MSRRLRIWFVFALCTALGVAAMAWMSVLLVRSDRAQTRAQQQTAVEAQVRQILWRLDYTFTFFLAPETSRPYTHFSPYYLGERVFTSAHEEVDRSELRIPSPLLRMEDPLVWLRVELDEAGEAHGPLLPSPAERALTLKLSPDRARLDRARERFKALRDDLAWTRLHEAMRAMGKPPMTLAELTELRQKSPMPLLQGSWVPTWIKENLCLIRQVWVGDRERLQVIVMDEREVRTILLSVVDATFPNTRIHPVPPEAFPHAGYTMTSLPIRLDPNLALPRPPLRAPLKIALAAAWIGFLAMVIMAAWVLHHTLALSERRGTFVSSVTHELRTPLTTFRLYLDLLVRDMVPIEERGSFLRTLQAEANRLDHLIRNVLSFARLEARKNPHREALQAGIMLDRIRERLEQRAELAGQSLAWDVPELVAARTVCTDPASVEQILFNLVDNACKYGVGPSSSLRLCVQDDITHLQISVQDDGPGIPPQERRRIFRPFHKSAAQAAHTRPGVGLGLPLSRSLARALDGDLRLGESPQGAEFQLRLPWPIKQ